MPLDRTIITNVVRRWMAGFPLNDRERLIVEALLQINAADQLIRCSEGVAL